MSAPTNAVTTLNTIGNREDLVDKIYRVAPEKTPFISNIGTSTAEAIYHEWQTENLATPNANNAQLEGDDVTTFDSGNQPVRVGSTCQIFRKTVVLSRTQEKVKTAGRASDLARQKALKMIEMRRDAEMRYVGNYGSVKVESGTTGRATAGALAWITTNSFSGAGGAAGGFNSGNVTAATNGTLRTFTEALVKAAMASSFNNGGEPSLVMMGATNKQEFSAFTGIAQARRETGNKMAKIIGAADVYVSDFGDLTLLPHAYGLSRDALGIDPSMWADARLDAQSGPLAKTGDSQKWLAVRESALECRNERSSFAIRDIQ